jgi:hypothetical protein
LQNHKFVDPRFVAYNTNPSNNNYDYYSNNNKMKTSENTSPSEPGKAGWTSAQSTRATYRNNHANGETVCQRMPNRHNADVGAEDDGGDCGPLDTLGANDAVCNNLQRPAKPQHAGTMQLCATNWYRATQTHAPASSLPQRQPAPAPRVGCTALRCRKERLRSSQA